MLRAKWCRYPRTRLECYLQNGAVIQMPEFFVVYTEDLPAVIKQHHVDHDLYTDDSQLSDHPSISSVAESIANIENCVSDVNKWCAEHLQLNPTKSEIIWFELPRVFAVYKDWISDYTSATISSNLSIKTFYIHLNNMCNIYVCNICINNDECFQSQAKTVFQQRGHAGKLDQKACWPPSLQYFFSARSHLW